MMQRRVLPALLALGLLAGCAARQPAPAPASPVAPPGLPWTAAIGQLAVGGGEPCTAILVAPARVVTAAHCLYQNQRQVSPQSLVFLPNLGATPALGQHRGRAIRAQGGVVHEGRVGPESIAADWALIDIEPPVTGVPPVPVVALSIAEINSRIAAGTDLYTAGYGYGGKKALKAHGKCRLVETARFPAARYPGILVTDCIIRVGDSGGPIALLDQSGQPSLVGILAGFGVNEETGLAFGSNAGNFAPYLEPMLISQWLGL